MENELEKVLKQQGLYEKVEELGIESPHDIISKSLYDLKKLLKINEALAEAILQAASKEVYDWRLRGSTGIELIQQQETPQITTGDEIIDNVLNGGVSLGMVTEIVGESSSGKTQLALQLCLAAQHPKSKGGLEGSAVYITSEGPFPMKRLDQLINIYPEKQQEDLRNNMFIFRVDDSEKQYRLLAYQLPGFLEKNKRSKRPVRIVVIDSISAVYRGEAPDIGRDRFNKMSEICDLGSRLKKMASEYNVAIVAINQVSDVVTQKDSIDSEHAQKWMDFRLVNVEENNYMIGLYINSLVKRPVLGLSWSNSVNTRIRLARSPLLENMNTRRVLFVEFSPIAPRLGCEIMINQSGVHAL